MLKGAGAARYGFTTFFFNYITKWCLVISII